ncbi:DUF6636 domain-containing protein [Mycolicibacterium sp. GF69]|uniref:DUF6636 domain-containing protein n=1 Tax=Mycolicibacterium sp. GF69 TaxID=2267251 RepID=UPI001F0C9BA0|nr:DUF6636 domain-containing protein [Mycolicibacterium sp. GF69]
MTSIRAAVSMAAWGVALAALAGCGGSPGTEDAPTTTGPTQSKALPTQDASIPSTASALLDREVSELTGFQSPSGNVSCIIDVDYVRCDILDRDWPLPPRPADCELDYGQGIEMNRGQRAQFVCAGDTTFGGAEVLGYGEAIRAGAMRCESAEAGVTCRDGDEDRGFFLSRESYQLF